MQSDSSTRSEQGCFRCGSTYKVSEITGFCDHCEKTWRGEAKLLNTYYNPSNKAVEGIRLLLEGLAETYPDLALDGGHFEQTPHRVARMFTELCWGLAVDPKIHLETSFEESNYNGIILVKDIQFVSLCKHHLVPFKGVAHVGYIPEKRIVGLSKINRVVEILAARPQVQEQLTHQITHIIYDTLKPKGVMTILQARHNCIEIRGVKSKGSTTITSEVTGIFIENSRNCKDEFLRLIRQDKELTL